MKTLCIAPCGDRKIWKKNSSAGPTKAKYVYTGPYARKCIEYAEKFYSSSWCILSAKHGFLFPDDIVPEPYNVTFKKKDTNPITVDELSIQAREKELDKYDKVIVLGGQDYSKVIKGVFCGKDIYEPLNGLKIGQRISKLNDAIKRGVLL
jgi:hypothetical protein